MCRPLPPRVAADRPGRRDPRFPRCTPDGTLRSLGTGAAPRSEQAHLPGHHDLARGSRLPRARRHRQDLPPGTVSDHARPSGPGGDAGQPRRTGRITRCVNPVRGHGGTLGGGRRSHHRARSGQPAGRTPGCRSGAELSVRATGRADVRAVGRPRRTGLAGQGADDPAAHRHPATAPGDHRVPRGRIPGGTTDPGRPAPVLTDGRHVRDAARRITRPTRRTGLRHRRARVIARGQAGGHASRHQRDLRPRVRPASASGHGGLYAHRYGVERARDRRAGTGSRGRRRRGHRPAQGRRPGRPLVTR